MKKKKPCKKITQSVRLRATNKNFVVKLAAQEERNISDIINTIITIYREGFTNEQDKNKTSNNTEV